MFGSHWHLLFKFEIVLVNVGIKVENELEIVAVVVEKSVGNVSVGKSVGNVDICWLFTIPDIFPFEQILFIDVIFFKLHNWK